MITIEQLNAIPGRPSELEWHPIADGTAFELDRTDTGHWFIRVKADGTAMKFYLSTYPSTPTELLDFATYIRRVEIELERMGGDRMTTLERELIELEEYLQSPCGQQAMAKARAVIDEFNSVLKRAETIDQEIVRRKLISSEGEPS